MNSGKRFETDFRESAEKIPELDVNRLADPIGGRAGVRNICDFIVYRYPHIYYLELKSVQENTLNFKNGITPNQWEGLSKKADVFGTIPGFLVNFSAVGETYFVHVSDMNKLRDEGAKSLHINDARKIGIPLEGTVKRVRYNYNVAAHLQKVSERFGRQAT